MGRDRGRLRSIVLLAVLGLGLTLPAAGPAAAATKHPTIKFVSPVCVSGLDVSLTGTPNWKAGPVGTVSVNWGDGNSEPSSFPDWHVYAAGGTYTITLTASNLHGSGTAKSTVIVGPSDSTCLYQVSPQPIAEGGSLQAGQSAPVVVSVTNAKGNAIKSPEPVWLSFVATPGGATASACCTAPDNPVPLATTPVALTTGQAGPAGEVIVTDTLPASPPDSGTDVLTASPVPDPSAAGATSTSYQYSSSPVPLTPPASIAADCSVNVSQTLGTWFRNLPPDSTVDPPSGACYQVDQGLVLKFPVNLTVDGGTYENLSTTPSGSDGNGTQRGNPVFNVLGGSGLTLENMTLEGANPGGYLAKMAFASGVQLQGTQDATLSGLTITHTFGDGITLDPLRNGANHKGSGIISATDNVSISNVAIDGAGRMGISLVSVNGATISTVSLANVGLDTFDVESDQGNEGAQNVDIDGCTASVSGPGDFFADGGAGSGKSTGNITVSNCVMNEAQAGTTIWISRPSSGTIPRGPFLFADDTFACGASTAVSCVEVIGGTATVQDSTFSFPAATPAELVYEAETGTTLTFTDDDATGYGTTTTGDPGTVDATSTVTVTGGTWTPAS